MPILILYFSNNSLFAVPANQEFVFIHTERSEVIDPVAYYLEQLRQNSTIVKDSGEFYLCATDLEIHVTWISILCIVIL